MTLRILIAIAAWLLWTSAAVAQGISPCPSVHTATSAPVMQAPSGVAGEPFSSMLIAETILLAPPASAPLPAPAAQPGYVGPGLTMVAPTPPDEGAPASAALNAYAAIDAGPTLVPPTSAYVLYRPSYDTPAR